MIRLFHVGKRLIIASGRAKASVLEQLCEAAVTQLEYNQRADISWSCQASEEKGHFVAVFERLKDGAPHPTALNAKQIDTAQEAVLLAYSRLSDPTAIEAYEARTLLRADEAYEVNIAPPKGMVQVLGRVVSITYDGTLQGQGALWQHEFKEDAAPALVADENTRLFLVGGRYQVADVGIIDEVPPDMPGGFEAVDFVGQEIAIPELGEIPLPGTPIEEVDPFAEVPFDQGAGMLDALEIESAIELDAYSQTFKDTIPAATPEQITRGIYYYEQLADAFGAESPLLQAQIAGAIMITKPSAKSVDALWSSALSQIGISDRKQRLELKRRLVDLALIEPDDKQHTGRPGHEGWKSGGQFKFGREQREQLRDIRNAVVFGGIVNEETGREVFEMVELVPDIEKLTQTQLAQLARVVLGLRGGKRGQASWTSMKKPELIDEFAKVGAQWNPTKKERPFSSAPLGSGGRFAACVSKMRARGNVRDPKALCASIGRKKYGSKRMAAMAKRGRRNPYTDAQRETFGELAELASNPARSYGLNQREIDTIVYNIIPIYQQDLAAQIEKLAPFADGGMTTNLIAQLERQIDEAESIAEKLDETESTGSNPTAWSGQGIDWPPHNLPLLTALALAAAQSSGRETPRYYGMIEMYFMGMVKGIPKQEEEYERELIRLYQTDPARLEVSLAAFLARQWRFLFDPSFRSNPLGFEEEELIIGVAPPNDMRTRDARDRDARTREGRGSDPTAWLNAQLEAFRRDNPKQDGRWHRKAVAELGTVYYLDAGDVRAVVVPYKPRKLEGSRAIAAEYELMHDQKIPKGTKYLAQTARNRGARGFLAVGRWTAHTTLAAAKKASERAMKRVRSNPTVANAGLLAGAPTGRGGFVVDAQLTNAGVLAMPGAPHVNSGGLPRVNAGLVDPPRTRRSRPRQF